MDNSTNESVFKSVIENGLEFKASTLTTTHDIRVNSKFAGKIISTARVLIDTNAVVTGDIVANELEIKGEVNGSCFAKGGLKLLSGCKVTGEILYGDLLIESGTMLTGTSAQVKPGEFEKVVKNSKSFKGVTFPVTNQSAPKPAAK